MNVIRLSVLLVSFSIFSAIISGCSKPAVESDHREFAKTYAGLAVLYEEQKITKQTTDSVYQVNVRDFLKSRGTDEVAFKLESDRIRSDIGAWRRFLVLVTSDVDSIKRARR